MKPKKSSYFPIPIISRCKKIEIRPRFFDKQKFTVTRTAIDLHIYSRNFLTKNQHRTEIDIFQIDSPSKAILISLTRFVQLSMMIISPVLILSLSCVCRILITFAQIWNSHKYYHVIKLACYFMKEEYQNCLHLPKISKPWSQHDPSNTRSISYQIFWLNLTIHAFSSHTRPRYETKTHLAPHRKRTSVHTQKCIHTRSGIPKTEKTKYSKKK